MFLLSNKNPKRRHWKGADPAFEILQYVRVKGPWAAGTDQGPLPMRQKCCKNPSCGPQSQGVWMYISISMSYIHIISASSRSVPGLSLVGSLQWPPHPFPSVSQFNLKKVAWFFPTEEETLLLSSRPHRHPTPRAPIDTHVCYKRCLHIINTSCKVAFLYRKMELCFFSHCLAAFESLFQKVF